MSTVNAEMEELCGRLHAERCSCVVRNGEDVRVFIRRGVVDLYELLQTEPAFLCGSSIADKVVGSAAAAVMVKGRVKSLYTDVISCRALALLEAAGVEVTYGELTEYVVNRDKTGMCPLETLCIDKTSVEEMLPLIAAFLTQRGMLGALKIEK